MTLQVISKYSQGVQPGDLGWNPTAPVSSPRPKWPLAQLMSNLPKSIHRICAEVRPHLHRRVPARGVGTGLGPTYLGKWAGGGSRLGRQEWNNMKLREIKHCRLAMVGFFFMVLRNASTGESLAGRKRVFSLSVRR